MGKVWVDLKLAGRYEETKGQQRVVGLSGCAVCRCGGAARMHMVWWPPGREKREGERGRERVRAE